MMLIYVGFLDAKGRPVNAVKRLPLGRVQVHGLEKGKVLFSNTDKLWFPATKKKVEVFKVGFFSSSKSRWPLFIGCLAKKRSLLPGDSLLIVPGTMIFNFWQHERG